MSVADVLIGFGVGSIVVALIQAVVARRKLAADTDKAGAEATSVLTAAALTLVQPLERRIHELTTEVAGLQEQVRTITADLTAARAANQSKDIELEQLRAARHTEGAPS